MLRPTATTAPAASRGGSRLPACATPITTKANSPACASNSATSAAAPRGTPKARATTNRIAAFALIKTMTPAAIHPASAAMTPTSILVPTVMKKMPSSSPLNGSRSTSMLWRTSLSESSRPARKAPSATDSPASPVASENTTRIRSVIAMIRSRLPVRSAERSSGRTTKRPASMMISTAASPSTKGWISGRMPPLAPFLLPVSSPTTNRIGTTMRSWNSSTESARRPT